ncbi:MAG: LemA family protein [Bacteroidia bacterium]|nr:LemA family protein [Bacteroidia bacterium]
MSKSRIYIILAVVVAGLFLMGRYNSMLKLSTEVDNAWANVETVYQARADKVKGLAAIVKNAADFEQETLTEVIEARAKATSVNISADNLTPENFAKFEQAQNQLTGSLQRLLLTVERYPDLKAVQAYRDFQHQYEGIENRIAVARKDFNGVATKYNYSIRKFPNVLLSGIFGFDEKPLFKASEGSEDAPEMDDLLNRD